MEAKISSISSGRVANLSGSQDSILKRPKNDSWASLRHGENLGAIDMFIPSWSCHLMNSSALCSGSSEIYIYFKHIQKMAQFGPYGPNHATAGTFAFKRELLDHHKYDDSACLAEEKSFLKDYTVPFVQLNPLKTILVFSHVHNTFDKKTLLDNKNDKYVKESDKTVDMFVNEKTLKDFFLNDLDDLLAKYESGAPASKPDVLQEIIRLQNKRNKDLIKHYQNQKTILVNNNGIKKEISMSEAVNVLQKQQNYINELHKLLEGKDMEIKILKRTLDDIRKSAQNIATKNKTKMPTLDLSECKTNIFDEINLEN